MKGHLIYLPPTDRRRFGNENSVAVGCPLKSHLCDKPIWPTGDIIPNPIVMEGKYMRRGESSQNYRPWTFRAFYGQNGQRKAKIIMHVKVIAYKKATTYSRHVGNSRLKESGCDPLPRPPKTNHCFLIDETGA